MNINFNLSKILNLNFLIILFILSYNLYGRFISIKILTEYEKLFILFLFALILICSFYKRYIKEIVSFCFGVSFFLFGFRPYDVQSQIFETLVMLVSIYYFFENILHNNYKTLNEKLRNLFIFIIILSLGSLLLLPSKYIFYNFFSLGKEWYLYQIVNVHPNSFYYPLNGVNRLILFLLIQLLCLIIL